MPFNSGGTYRTPSLFDATYRVGRILDGVTEGVATGGSTTTIVDTRILTQADDHYNQGMAWILRDSAESAAAPEEEFGEVTDFTASNDTATIGSVSAGSGDPFTVAVAAGDRYALTTSKYPPHQLIMAVNGALQDILPTETSDITTVDTATSQTEYSIALAANKDLRKVWYQGRTGDTNDNRWIPIQNWDIRRTAVGTADLLILPFQYVTGRDIRLDYVQEHLELDDAADHISEDANFNHLVIEAAIRMLEWRDSQPGNDPNIERQLFRLTEQRGADGLTKRERASSSHKPVVTPRQSKLLILGRRVPVDQFRINP